MKTASGLICHIPLASLLLGASLLFIPHLAHAQSSGLSVDVCSVDDYDLSGDVGGQDDVEMTACLSGDSTGLNAYASASNSNLNEYEWSYPNDGIEAQLVDNNGAQVVWDSGQLSLDQASWTLSSPQLNMDYSLWDYYSLCYDSSGDGDSQNCSWDYVADEEVDATVLQGYQGYVDPKFIVLGVTYAPPGPSSNTWVQYLNSSYFGATESLTNSFTSSTTYSVSITTGGSILGVLDAKVTQDKSTTNSQTTTNGDSVTVSIQVQNGEKTYGTGDYFAPVDNDYDTIWIWLNPVAIFTVADDNEVVWNGYGYDENDQNGMDIVGIPLGYLNGDWGPMPSQYLALTNRSWAANQVWPAGQGPALTSADFAQIASADPFSSSSYGSNYIGYDPPNPSTSDNRFSLSACNGGNSFGYDQGSPNSQANIFTCTLTYENLSTQSQGLSSTYSQTFSVDQSFTGSKFLGDFGISTGNSTTLSWKTEAQSSITQSSTSTGSLSVQGPSCNNTLPSYTCNPAYDANGNEPTQFNVYQDNVYGSFMFAPVHYY